MLHFIYRQPKVRLTKTPHTTILHDDIESFAQELLPEHRQYLRDPEVIREIQRLSFLELMRQS